MTQPEFEEAMRKALGEAVDRILDKLNPPTKTFRSACVRQLDELGRVVLDMNMRRGLNLAEKDGVMLSVVVDDANRVRGILCEPLDYVIHPDTRPTFEEATAKMLRTDETPRRGPRQSTRLVPGPDLVQQRRPPK